MNRRLLTTLLPICLLGSPACIDVPDIDPPGQTVGNFSLSIDPSQASVLQGGSRGIQLSLSRSGGFTDSVTVQLINPPSGISAQPVTIGADSTSATLTISATSSAAPGPKTLTVRGTSGTLAQDVTVSLTVARQGDILVQWASPSQSKAYAKDSLQIQVLVEGGTADSVDLYKGTDFLTRLSGPSYQYTWDTSQETEGEYQLTARATVGGDTFTSSTRTIVVDHTAPKVSTRAPAPGATSVSVRDTIQVSFDEALKASSVTDASVVLNTGGASNIAKTLSLSTDGKTLTISPSAPLSLPADVSITLGTTTAPLMDLAGNVLVSSSSWNFTVPTWLPLGGAISAVTDNTPAENVAMKVGTDGNPVIAWSESAGATKNIYVRRWTGTKWEDLGTAMSAVADTGTHADKPALTLDASNRPIVVWQELTAPSGSDNLYGRRWTGTTWDALPSFNLDSATSGDNASIVFDSVGNLLVSATLVSGGTFERGLFRLMPTANSWESLSGSLPEGYTRPKVSTLATDASGNWFLALRVLDSDGSKGYQSIPVLKKGPATNWAQLGAPVTSPAKNGCVSASLAVDGSGQPFIAWEEGETPTSHVHAAFWHQDSSSWRMLNTTVDASTTSNKDPSLVLDHSGNPMVAWSGYASPEQSIWVSRWNGSTWQQVGSRLSAVTGPSTSGFRPALGLDKNGEPLVAWHESDGTVSNVYVYRYNY
ncbi:Ig-like domain-containing protein [Archangium violaceum]|uniref:Ig-like domain-containing protein n=1 Tax=Archangium violaceum TaxID=83451 RepID=UPI00193BA3E1|nr:Ig-like domain-containing protein [Archangium violaceum]QRK05127.1 Ig-like domain-containing protein [Archangium violaceum]